MAVDKGRIREVLRGTWHGICSHDYMGLASEVAFDFAFSLFPCLLFLAGLLSVIGISPETFNGMLSLMGNSVPLQIKEIVADNVFHLIQMDSKGILTAGLLGTLWAASSAISATMNALNLAYGVKETRPFWRRRVLSIVLVVGVGIVLLISFNVLMFGVRTLQGLERLLQLNSTFSTTVSVVRWPVVFVSVTLVVSFIYHIAPNLRQEWWRVFPGSIFFGFLWVLLTRAFGFYVDHFGYYNRIHGVLGVIIILLLWLYMTSFILLVGGQLNSELWRVPVDQKREASEDPLRAMEEIPR